MEPSEIVMNFVALIIIAIMIVVGVIFFPQIKDKMSEYTKPTTTQPFEDDGSCEINPEINKDKEYWKGI
jgi:hypothetical protein